MARGLPCPVGLLRSGRRNTLVIKATFRLDGVDVWATTQAPLREAVTDDFGRRVFPSDYQAHKSACDVVIAGATLNAQGPVRLRLGRHQMFADEPRALGPVPLADARREASFARPNQQLPLPEFPLQLEVVLAGARTLLRVATLPIHAAIITRDDWSSASDVPLNLDAVLVDPMREVAELVFRGFFAHAGDLDREVLVIVGPRPLMRQPMAEAARWPRTEALEPRTRSVRETSFDLDEETFIPDADAEEMTRYPTRPELDEESTGIHSAVRDPSWPAPTPVHDRLPTTQMEAFDPESTRPHNMLSAAPEQIGRQFPFAAQPPRKTFTEEATQVDLVIAPSRPAETPFTPEATQLHVVAPTLGGALPFAPESTRFHVLSGDAEPPAELPFKRAPARTLIGGQANRALPFQGTSETPPARAPSVAPEAGLPFRNETLAIPIAAIPREMLATPVSPPASPAFAPLAVLGAAAPSPPAPSVMPPAMAPIAVLPPTASTLAPSMGPSAIALENLPTPVASPPAPAIIAQPAPTAPPTRAPGFVVEGLTIEQYADIRGRLWRGEPRLEVLREHKLNEIRFRVLEKKLQRYLDGLPPSELGKILDLLG